VKFNIQVGVAGVYLPELIILQENIHIGCHYPILSSAIELIAQYIPQLLQLTSIYPEKLLKLHKVIVFRCMETDGPHILQFLKLFYYLVKLAIGFSSYPYAACPVIIGWHA